MAAKRSSGSRASQAQTWLRSAWAFVNGPGRPLVAILLAAAILLGFWYVVWHVLGFGAKTVNAEEYFLTEDDLEITPTPAWIHTDLRSAAFRLACPDQKSRSILDDQLVERVRAVFTLEPWVAKVRSVQKSHPPKLKVDLEYRRPACMVEVPGGLFPVDSQGILLPHAPHDFSPLEANAYPRLAGIDTLPSGAVGTRWGDPRVVGGAEIAAVLIDQWQKLQLQLIRPLPRSDAAPSDITAYCLFTNGGTRILWGLPPGVPSSAEPPAAEKINRLKTYAESHGSLDGQRFPHEIDLRDLRAIRVMAVQGN